MKDTLAMSLARRRRLPAWAIAAGIAAVFLGLVLAARVTGHWRTDVEPRVYLETIPRASELDHPR